MESTAVCKDSGSASGALDERSRHLRRLVMRALLSADFGHVSSALSLIEVFRVLYDDVVKHDPSRPGWPERDPVILSKGHGCLALYAVLADHGYFPLENLNTFCARHSLLGGHPERQLEIGIEASTGALGHGLPLAVGVALAHRRRRDSVRVFVIVGDGELNEGSNWEALLIASKYKLNNLTVIVDNNADQISGPIETVLPLEPLRAKLDAFGANTVEIDGHKVAQLRAAFGYPPPLVPGQPRAIICHTIKGRGLPFAERNPLWHYKRGFEPETIKEIEMHLTE
jgi:transketolase